MREVTTTPHGNCPACGSATLTEFFSTTLPVHVGKLNKDSGEALRAPFGDVVLCFCSTCALVHNVAYDDSLVEFEPGYEVSLIHSPCFRAYLDTVACRLVERYDLRNKRVVEIGCGMGEFLGLICERGANEGIGFDPTIPETIEKQVGDGRISLFRGYYDQRQASLAPDLLCSLSVFECVPRPLELLRTVRETLGDCDTVVYFEVFNGARAIEEGSGWSIHYETCNYWSLESLIRIFERCRFQILDAGTCFGESEYIYVEARPTSASEKEVDVGVLPMPNAYAEFSSRHDSRSDEWRRKLAKLADRGERVAVWGTGGKGISFLSSLPRDRIGKVVDISPTRQGRYVPGSGHRIEAPESLVEFQPTVIVVTNPLYREEIARQVDDLGVPAKLMVA